jgi:hypothetical protein
MLLQASRICSGTTDQRSAQPQIHPIRRALRRSWSLSKPPVRIGLDFSLPCDNPIKFEPRDAASTRLTCYRKAAEICASYGRLHVLGQTL